MPNQGKRVDTGTGLTVEYSPVTVDAILTPEDARESGIETNKYRVQLRQTVKTKYPAARSNALFQAAEFGEGQEFEEKRVTWLNVPKGVTVQQVEERLNALPCPTLVRTLGLKPILSQEQLTAMERGINTKTWEQYTENFIRTSDGGVAVKWADRLQYRAIHFSEDFADDNDNRMADLSELKAEEEAEAREKSGAVQMASGVTQHQEVAPATY